VSEEDVAEIEAKVDRLDEKFARMDGRFDQLETKVDRVMEILLGDGERPGISGRIRDLEANCRTRSSVCEQRHQSWASRYGPSVSIVISIAMMGIAAIALFKPASVSNLTQPAHQHKLEQYRP
jgi:hypothetical protein